MLYLEGEYAEEDHPRIRGEQGFRRVMPFLAGGSPPHTRGAGSEWLVQTGSSGITPAYAGSSIDACNAVPMATDHPRIRGEQAVSQLPTLTTCWITPAYAGSSSVNPAPPLSLPDHPRIRGEQQHQERFPAVYVGSPPHTRGAGGERGLHHGACRITPAYAGSRLNKVRSCQSF